MQKQDAEFEPQPVAPSCNEDNKIALQVLLSILFVSSDMINLMYVGLPLCNNDQICGRLTDDG